jgi:hypothetical protein
MMFSAITLSEFNPLSFKGVALSSGLFFAFVNQLFLLARQCMSLIMTNLSDPD